MQTTGNVQEQEDQIRLCQKTLLIIKETEELMGAAVIKYMFVISWEVFNFFTGP